MKQPRTKPHSLTLPLILAASCATSPVARPHDHASLCELFCETAAQSYCDAVRRIGPEILQAYIYAKAGKRADILGNRIRSDSSLVFMVHDEAGSPVAGGSVSIDVNPLLDLLDVMKIQGIVPPGKKEIAGHILEKLKVLLREDGFNKIELQDGSNLLKRMENITFIEKLLIGDAVTERIATLFSDSFPKFDSIREEIRQRQKHKATHSTGIQR